MRRPPSNPVPAWLMDVVREEINELDPIGLLKNGAPEDEYKREIDDIANRIYTAQSPIQVQTIIFAVFVYKFDLEEALPIRKYADTTRNIWAEMEAQRKS